MTLEEFIAVAERNAWRVPLRKTEDREEVRQDLRVRALEKFRAYEAEGKAVTSGLAYLLVSDAVHGRRWSGRAYSDVSSDARSIEEGEESASFRNTENSLAVISNYFKPDLFIGFLDFVEVMEARLDDRKREVFNLLLQGFSQQEITVSTGLSKGRISQICAEIRSEALRIS